MRRALAPLLLLCAAGCAEDFLPRSALFDLRVLAVEASPLEVGPDESVTLRAVRVAPGQTIVSESWSFCPFSIGATAAYECAVPCEVPLDPSGPAPDAWSSPPVTEIPGDRVLECLGASAFPADFPERLEVLFRYVAVARSPDGSTVTREAVQRLPLHVRGVTFERNRPPRIDAVELGAGNVAWQGGAATGAPAVLRPGGTLDVIARVGDAQTYVEGGRELVESLVVSFHATDGRFDFDRANGPDALVTLEYREIAGPTDAGELWVVARDLRGGQAVAGPIPFTVE